MGEGLVCVYGTRADAKIKTKVSDEFRRSTERTNAIQKKNLKLAEISILKYLSHADQTDSK